MCRKSSFALLAIDWLVVVDQQCDLLLPLILLIFLLCCHHWFLIMISICIHGVYFAALLISVFSWQINTCNSISAIIWHWWGQVHWIHHYYYLCRQKNPKQHVPSWLVLVVTPVVSNTRNKYWSETDSLDIFNTLQATSQMEVDDSYHCESFPTITMKEKYLLKT